MQRDARSTRAPAPAADARVRARRGARGGRARGRLLLPRPRGPPRRLARPRARAVALQPRARRGGPPGRRPEALLEAYERRGSFETVLLVDGDELSRRASRSARTGSRGPQELVAQGQLAYERTEVGDTPYLVTGGRVPARTRRRTSSSRRRSSRTTSPSCGTSCSRARASSSSSPASRARSSPGGRSPRSRARARPRTRSPRACSTPGCPSSARTSSASGRVSFNEMADALEAKITALSEAQARERRFTADVAHELRTPLTAIVNEASLLAEHIERMPPEARRPGRAARRGREAPARPRRGPDGDLAARCGNPARPAGASRPRLARRHGRPRPRLVGSGAARGRRGRARDRPQARRANRRPTWSATRSSTAAATSPCGSARTGVGAFVEVSDRGPGHRARKTCRTCSSASTRPTRPARAAERASASRSRSRTPASSAATSRSGASQGVGTRFTLRLPVTEPLRGGESGVADARHA